MSLSREPLQECTHTAELPPSFAHALLAHTPRKNGPAEIFFPTGPLSRTKVEG